MAIDFVSDAQRETYKRTARFMIGLFGDNCTASAERPMFCIEIGSAEVEVLVLPWHDEAIVMARATVVSGATGGNELATYLLTENMTIDLGGFALTAEGDVVFKHAIMGARLDENELRMTVWSVMKIADDYDDRIKRGWGGQRAIDRSGEVKVQTGEGRIDGDFSDATAIVDPHEIETKIGMG